MAACPTVPPDPTADTQPEGVGTATPTVGAPDVAATTPAPELATSTPVPTDTPPPAPQPTATPTAMPTSTPTPTPAPTPTPEPTPTPTHGPQASSASDPTPQAAPTPLPFSPGAAPHVFVGTATINGLAAPQGTIISAWVEGTLSGVSEVDSNGEYGALIVGQIIGEPSYGGKTITFTIGNLTAWQTAIWQSGSADVLDLTATE